MPPEHRDRSAPLLPWLRLYRRTSAKGRVYFAGVLGSLRVVAFEEPASDGVDAHLSVHVTERPAQPATSARPAQRSPAPETPRPSAREHRDAAPELVFD
jgi:hypothetical protein